MTTIESQLARFGQALVDAWNSNDLDRVAGMHSTKFVGLDVARSTPIRGPEGVRQALGGYLRAFPDMRVEVEDMVADGSRVALTWVAHGTHRGEIMRIPPTNRIIDVRGMLFFRVADNRIDHAECVWDVAGMLRCLGLLPDL